MFDSDIKEFYLARTGTNAVLDKLTRALNPFGTPNSIAAYSSFADSYLNHPQWAGVLRIAPEEDFARWYDYETIKKADAAMAGVKKSIRAELDLYGLCVAVEEYYRTSNSEIPQYLRDDNQKALRASEERLSKLTEVQSDMGDIAEDQPDDEDRTVPNQMDEVRELKREEYLGRLRNGYDYRTLRDLSLNMIAGVHMETAETFSDSASLQVAMQILRLERDPTSFGHEAHQDAYRTFTVDMRHASVLTELAAKAAPESTTGVKAENNNGGPKPPHNKLN